MAIWNRTAHYEDLVLEKRGRLIVAPLYAALLDLFSHLPFAAQLYYAKGNQFAIPSTLTTTEKKEAVLRMDILLEKIKGMEDEAHVQANWYLQWKQTHILETMQREQAEMAAKLEEAMTTKMQLLEDNMSEELRTIRETLIGQKVGLAPTHTEEEGDTTGGAVALVCEQHKQQEVDEGR
jgi:hypothetical protein